MNDELSFNVLLPNPIGTHPELHISLLHPLFKDETHGYKRIEFDMSNILPEKLEGIRFSIQAVLNSHFCGNKVHRFINYYDMLNFIEEKDILNLGEITKLMLEVQDALEIQERPLQGEDRYWPNGSAMGSWSRAMFMNWISLRMLAPITSHLLSVSNADVVLELWSAFFQKSRYADFFWCLMNWQYTNLAKTDPVTKNRYMLKRKLVTMWLCSSFVYIHPVTNLSVSDSKKYIHQYLFDYFEEHDIDVKSLNIEADAIDTTVTKEDFKRCILNNK